MDGTLASATGDDDEDVDGIMHLPGFVEMTGLGKSGRQSYGIIFIYLLFRCFFIRD